ncbi:MAG: ABC-F family ATP-binding cassette domain-containing protein [Armatimonadetes bacterium]|nr:ABC-F family ATP-binding cassette domain-containing protein [Armatimonadota bacterium]
MSILTVSNVAKSFGSDELFSEVNFTLAPGQKMGLIGRNGGGKTTLLKIILGQETPDPTYANGIALPPRVALAPGRHLGYLRQEAPVHPEHTIAEEIDLALAPMRAIQARVTEAEHAMSDAKTDTEIERAMTDYTAALDEFEARGGYAIEDERDAVMIRLGFGAETLHKLVGACSGGEQTRLALAKLVLTRPDLLILDEPTNHLDIQATEWLETFVKNYEGAVLLVSHDRYFLDAVTDTTAELEFRRLTIYKGNYSHYRRQKEEAIAVQEAAYKNQQNEIERLQGLIKRNMGANATQSVIRHKTQGRIDRMEKIEAVKTDTTRVKARLDAAGAGRIGREVVRLTDLSKTYGERTLFKRLSAAIERDDRVGLVGPNGAGKTTLVKILLGDEKPTTGEVAFGNNVRVAYFSQHATDDLDVEMTVLDCLWEEAVGWTETQARNHLARFLFTGDDTAKRVGMLSGGEKNKLALSRMLLRPCNLLILDEPTNHLDIESCETLTEMLKEYAGTLLLVSHDRYLLNAVTTKTLGFTGDGGSLFAEGNYAAWREELANVPAQRMAGVPKPKNDLANLPPVPVKVAPPKPVNRGDGKARSKAQDAVAKAERRVQDAEGKLSEVEALLASGKTGLDMVTLASDYARAQDAVNVAVAAWETASAEWESFA